jgi:hypothetical protein
VVLLLRSGLVDDASMYRAIAQMRACLPPASEGVESEDGSEVVNEEKTGRRADSADAVPGKVGKVRSCEEEDADIFAATAVEVVPVLAAQLSGRRRWCAGCLGAFPSRDLELCDGCEQVGYCSIKCRQAHWSTAKWDKEVRAFIGGHGDVCPGREKAAAGRYVVEDYSLSAVTAFTTTAAPRPLPGDPQNLEHTPALTPAKKKRERYALEELFSDGAPKPVCVLYVLVLPQTVSCILWLDIGNHISRYYIVGL